MKIKCLPLLAAFLTVSFIVTSCLNSDETEATYSFNSSITAFSLGTLHIDRMGIDSNGEDSAYVDTINCAKYPFSIDQTTRVIENKDSLPVGTHIDKVVTDLTADSDVIFYTKNGKDTLWTSTDSIDFTMNDPETGVQEHAVMFGVYAYSGTRGKTYKVKVNVHLQEPDTITWKNFNSPAFSEPLAEMKAVYAGGKVFVFGKDGTETVIRYMEVSSGEPQAWQDVEVTGLSSIQAASATVWRDEVYFLANGGKLCKIKPDLSVKTDLCGETFTQLIAGADYEAEPVMYACTADGSGILSADYTWTLSDPGMNFAADKNIFSANAEVSYNSNLHRTIVMVDDRAANDTAATVYSRLSNGGWMEYATSNAPLPGLENISMISYDKKLYAFGGKSTASGTTLTRPFGYFFSSTDNGLTWQQVEEEMAFPQEAAEKGANGITESFGKRYTDNGGAYAAAVSIPQEELNAEGALNPSFIWIVWGDGTVSRGHINRLGFKPKQW